MLQVPDTGKPISPGRLEPEIAGKNLQNRLAPEACYC